LCCCHHAEQHQHGLNPHWHLQAAGISKLRLTRLLKRCDRCIVLALPVAQHDQSALHKTLAARHPPAVLVLTEQQQQQASRRQHILACRGKLISCRRSCCGSFCCC
jgi:hypothetical protein